MQREEAKAQAVYVPCWQVSFFPVLLTLTQSIILNPGMLFCDSFL